MRSEVGGQKRGLEMQIHTVPQRPSARPTILAALVTLALLPAALAVSANEPVLPWSEAGLSEREAAAHLLDRFAFGARPGEVDQVVAMGLEVWLEQQLAASLPDPVVEQRLEGYRTVSMSASELKDTYPIFFRIRRQAERAGVVSGDTQFRPGGAGSSPRTPGQGRPGGANREQMRKLFDFAESRGYRPLPELIDELTGQKLYRALHSENQLREVLTDFWFNHFNVSLSDNDAQQYVLAYERDAIRPNVLGSFEEMLVATARHPAMLQYLDNASSVAAEGTKTLPRFGLGRQGLGRRGLVGRRRGAGRPGGVGTVGGGPLADDPELRRIIEERRPRGLNENYARELMELHTLGVDGGYSQTDVIEVARALTGWTIYPGGPRGGAMRARLASRSRGSSISRLEFGESFLFRAEAHDAEEKTILGQEYPAGRGVEEGLQVLKTLSSHPSTAQHLAHKLAVRFVSDQPPPSLVDRLARRFLATEGDLAQVVRALAESPEFWSAESRRGKIKSPFELATSALRSLGAEVEQPYAVIDWIAKMGQPLYAFQAPTGYPDRANAWLNTGSLVARMNFGLQLATRRVPGVRVDLVALGQGLEPGSMTAALERYLGLLLPERDPGETTSQLSAVLADPGLAEKIEAAARREGSTSRSARADSQMAIRQGGRRVGRGGWYQRQRVAAVEPASTPEAHVVGVILGSPEFQRR